MRYARSYGTIGALAGLLAPAGLLVYEVLLGAPDVRLVLALLTFGGVVTLGGAGWMIGRRDDALAAQNRALASLSNSLRALSATDALTGIPNRRAFDQRLALEVTLAARYDRDLAVVIVDLDRFKDVNDRLGHSVGDLVLREVARRLDAEKRAGDLVARFGGEEFVALLPHSDRAAAEAWAERARRAIEATAVTTPAGPLGVTASFGVAAVRHGKPAASALVDAADRALYRAKRAGRNRVACAEAAASAQASLAC